MIEVFKITHGLYDDCIPDDFLPMCTENRLRAHNFKIEKWNCHYNLRKHSFTFRTTDQWNNLPDFIVNAETVRDFEMALDKLWNVRNKDVLYDPDCDIRALTSQRNIRFTNTSNNEAQA